MIFAAAHEAGVPIYAGTDAGGYLPHGLIGPEIAALGQLVPRRSTPWAPAPGGRGGGSVGPTP